jgi:hypothetical protein
MLPWLRRPPRWPGLVAVLWLAGCASVDVKPPDTAYQASIGTLAVVASEQMPALKFEGFARGKGRGVASGAGGTFGACLSGMGGAGCSGDFCGAAVLLLLGICGVAGIVGGIAGAAEAPSLSGVESTETVLVRTVDLRSIQSALRDEVETVALRRGAVIRSIDPESAHAVVLHQDFRALAGQGVDTVLETTLTQAGTRGHGINDPLEAYMQVRARLVRARDNVEIRVEDYVFTGRRLKLAEWADNEGKPMLEEFRKGYRVLAGQVYENLFELYPYPDRQVHSGGGVLSTAFGLAPITPPTRGQLTGDVVIGRVFEWVATDSLMPSLRWQAFPRESDRAIAPQEMARVRNVTYDLVIAREEDLAPAEIVYERRSLPSAEHALETALKPSSRYFWSIRAHFELDGRLRVTEWGATHYLARGEATAPSPHSYRFRTPASE